MKIGILGATSQIAKDLILSFSDEHQLELFSREATAMGRWMVEKNLRNYNSRTYFDFPAANGLDAIINFVGAGNPERVRKMGTNIFYITETFDRMAMEYLEQNKNCLYIFMSSGAAFGDNFSTPADAQKCSVLPINNLQPEHYYGAAKAMAEIRHRVSDRNIIDLRVYNYFSHTMSLKHRFMITDIIRSIQEGVTYRIDRNQIVRDYIGPLDFYQMINVLLSTDNINTAIDCYSRQPVSKDTLLTKMAERYGLQYETTGYQAGLPTTGVKEKYYSSNTAAYALGYRPTLTSLETIFIEADKILK
jgi:hypothetical protein